MDLNSRKNSAIIIALVAAVLAGVFIFQWQFGPEQEFELQLVKRRKSRDKFLKTHKNSPLSDQQKASFEGLEYFDIDPTYRVYAKYIPNPEYEKVEMGRTNGDTVTYVKGGKLKFRMRGEDHVLTAYHTVESSGNLFVPFRDETTGKTTYGGGRYIDTRKVKDRKNVELDFNQAYNPDCVFNIESRCPIPPKENRLRIEVNAGEKDWKH